MEEIYHIPAMLKETIEGLAIKPNGVYVDVTFGGGGHSRAILNNLTPTLSTREGDEGEGSRMSSGITDDEKSGMASRGKEEEKEKGEGEKTCGQNEGHLYSFDQDIEAYENVRKIQTPTQPSPQGEGSRMESGGMDDAGFVNDTRWTFVHSNFRYLRNWMDYYGVKEIDGLLADLGVSFHHFDCPERGFSFRFSAPLDMRMNQTAKRTAADIVNGYSEEELAKIFWLYGEMKNGRGIARNICKARSQKPILRTEELINAALNIKAQPHPNPPHEGEGSRMTSGIMDDEKNTGLKTREQDEGKNPPSIADTRELEIPAQYKKDLARLFQALRIEVNDEMGALREMLVAARDLVKPGGRIAILTYHSLEDRLVKNFFRSGNLEGTIEKDFYGNAITPFDVIEKGRVASDDEVERNPRSRSAKLRVAEKKGEAPKHAPERA